MYLCLRKTEAGKSQNYCDIVFEKAWFVHTKTKPAFSIPLVWWTFSKKLHFCEKLVWMAGPSIEIKLCFKFLWRRVEEHSVRVWITYSSTPWKDHLIKPFKQLTNASNINIKNIPVQVFLTLFSATSNARKHLHIWNITCSTIKILWSPQPASVCWQSGTNKEY